MESELREFHHQLTQEVRGYADADGRYVEDSFFEYVCDYLIEVGEVSTADRARYEQRGLRVDGYGGDPVQQDGVLCLFIVDFTQSPELMTLTQGEMNAAFKRLESFATKALDARFRNSLEDTSPAFGLADMINERFADLTKIRMILLSDRQLSKRVDGVAGGTAGSIPVTYSVWDIGRLYRVVASGRGREEMTIDLEEDFGGPIPVLPAHLDEAGYEAYLAVIPGSQLAAIYDRWSTRLLEQNVRVFLQARGNVNKGIRNTLDDEPERFFAYNNGITATAEDLQTKQADGGLMITSLTNLQIVNGGQTTASIHAAMRDKKRPVDLSRVFVPMKLSIIQPSKAIEIVPLISQYANSQNKVSAADFFSNHPFHVRIEEFSRRILAPSVDGALRESKWFYERARGQYQDERSRRSGSALKKFDGDYPKAQVFTKTDLAKFDMTWRQRPDTVSKGAQKNFAAFAEQIASEWSRDDTVFSEDYYRHAIGKAIVFRTTEKLVSAQPWYDGGYRANIVTYAIAKLVHATDELGQAVDLGKVWAAQAVPDGLREAIAVSAAAVHGVIVSPPAGTRNVTEWAKNSQCWKQVKALPLQLPSALQQVLVSRDEARHAQREARRDQAALNGIQAQMAVVVMGEQYWRRLKRWAETRGRLTDKESSIIELMATTGYVSEDQARVLAAAVQRLESEGCALAREFGR